MMLVAVFNSGETIPFVISYCNKLIKTDKSLTLVHDDTNIVIDDYAYYHAFEAENLEDETEMVKMMRKFFVKLHTSIPT